LGSWNNYRELKNYVKEYQETMNKNGLTTKTAAIGDKSLVAFDMVGKTVAVDLVSNTGGNIIAAGGNNVKAAVGGLIIAGGAGNIISGGAGNFSSLAGVTHQNIFSTLSEGAKAYKASGKGVLCFK
jgi:hypothetical protein